MINHLNLRPYKIYVLPRTTCIKIHNRPPVKIWPSNISSCLRKLFKYFDAFNEGEEIVFHILLCVQIMEIKFIVKEGLFLFKKNHYYFM
jgi:hypothetical protein